MHSADFGKELKCTSCGAKFPHPLCDTYEYQGADRFFTYLPHTEVGYCTKCNKIVCIQKGIKYSDAIKELKNATKERKKYFKSLVDLLQGRDSVDSCCECGNVNVISLSNYVCPSCNKGTLKAVREKEDSGIRFHFGREYILPTLREEKDKVAIVTSQGNLLKLILKWIGVLPVSIIAWFVSYWIINLFYNVFSPVEMTKWAITIMSSGISGMAFVLAGAWLAPKGKKITSVVLATIMGVFALVSMTFALMGYEGKGIAISIVSAVSTIAGCIFGSIQIHNE